jgi:hypothetical protein
VLYGGLVDGTGESHLTGVVLSGGPIVKLVEDERKSPSRRSG